MDEQQGYTIESIVHSMLKQRNIDKYTLEIEKQGGAGDGYLGDVIFFRIIETNHRIRRFVLKRAKENKKLRSSVAVDKVFDRELSMYSKIFPQLKSFLNEKGIREFLNFVPEMWYNCSDFYHESIILENLEDRDFHSWNRKKPLTLSHIEIVLKCFGKWHGLTIAFRNQNPDIFENTVKNWIDVKVLIQEQFDCTSVFKREFKNILNILLEKGREDIVDVYSKIENQIDDIVSRNGDKNDFLCITHGDCWINNYMFKYEKSGIPIGVCFLDFQLSMVDSPVIDLSSFFYNVADKNAYSNFEYLLEIYYKSFSATMKSLGSDPEKIFSMGDLKRHWKKYGFFGVIMSLILMKLQLCEPEEAPELGKIAERGESLVGAFGFKIGDMETFHQRIIDIFIHYGEYLKSQND